MNDLYRRVCMKFLEDTITYLETHFENNNIRDFENNNKRDMLILLLLRLERVSKENNIFLDIKDENGELIV